MNSIALLLGSIRNFGGGDGEIWYFLLLLGMIYLVPVVLLAGLGYAALQFIKFLVRMRKKTRMDVGDTDI